MANNNNTHPTPEQIALRKKMAADENKYKWMVLAEFFCRYFDVEDVPLIEPFGKRTYCWEPLKETKMTVEVLNTNVKFHIRTNDAEGQVVNCPFTPDTWKTQPQPKPAFVHPITNEPMQHDLSRVMIYSITCKHYRLNVPIQVAPRLNFYHEGMAQLQESREKDEMFAAAGAIRGAFTVLKPVNGGADMHDVPLPELHFAYQNQYFTRTMALVNDKNLMHGIVVIPRNVCLAADLPVWKGSLPEVPDDELVSLLESMKIDPKSEEGIQKKQSIKEQIETQRNEDIKDKAKIEYFVAIPIVHVLAWGYQSEEFAALRGHRVLQFRYYAPGGQAVVLYYMVDNIQFDFLVAGFKRDWMRKVDVRPLTDIGFQFLPMLMPKYEGIPDEAVTVTGALSMRARIKFVSAPRLTQATIDNLAPMLIPGFPQCHEWSLDGVAQQIAIEKLRLAQEKEEKANKRKNKIKK